MQTPITLALNTRYKGFFATHAVGAVLRSVFLSSIMWVLLAGTVYTVYTMVVNAHTDQTSEQQLPHRGL